jgi:hypothetical protein
VISADKNAVCVLCVPYVTRISLLV